MERKAKTHGVFKPTRGIIWDQDEIFEIVRSNNEDPATQYLVCERNSMLGLPFHASQRILWKIRIKGRFTCLSGLWWLCGRRVKRAAMGSGGRRGWLGERGDRRRGREGAGLWLASHPDGAAAAQMIEGLENSSSTLLWSAGFATTSYMTFTMPRLCCVAVVGRGRGGRTNGWSVTRHTTQSRVSLGQAFQKITNTRLT